MNDYISSIIYTQYTQSLALHIYIYIVTSILQLVMVEVKDQECM